MTTEEKQFTRSELKSRNSKKDAVIIIHNMVYDITKFLDEHPGGEEVLLEKAGHDASEPFEDVGHSSDARELMKKYQIGEVVEADKIEVKKKSTTWSTQQEENSSGWNSWVVPLILGVAATILYRYLFA